MVFDGRSVTFSALVESVCCDSVVLVVCGSVGILVVTTPSTVVLLFVVVWSDIWLDPSNIDVFRSVVAPL